MSSSAAIAVAVTFVWLGMVLGLSFLEAPLKFRAPGVTTTVGLGIGRVVFRALNIVEVAFALVLFVLLVVGGLPVVTVAALGVALLDLAAQLAVVRPRLNRRSRQVLAGERAPGSRGHLVYIALEVLKVLALATGGVALLTG